ncbi:DtxR family manganese transport transcriptional regulator [Rubricella aquisinus]|uniref:Transcriptional regulator MntR n=1 Tax=Rubricella aquisinus TaxID=2028108 RepID=A0A840WPR2_9RHOB|nr:manganese-binding transcriptional regulator MntR [Rubricella aquisinus]MBB5517038.1 DtxR family manganese transport transcriptional regulator [Rubricella aquisinus]
MTDTAPLPDEADQARTFTRLREAHASEVTEDYVELIADLIDSEGEARAVALANRFGVTPATVNNTVKRLERDGYVTSRPYRSIFLTDKGRALAEDCRERHQIVTQFLLALGVSADVAEADAEGIEHHVSAETLDAFRNFIATK